MRKVVYVMRTSIRLIRTTLLVALISAGNGLVLAQERGGPVAPTSTVARSAMRKYEGALAKAQAEYDRKSATAREAFLKEMDVAMKDATRQGKLEEALAIKAETEKARKSADVSSNEAMPKLIGRWTLVFTNGVRRTYDFDGDGNATWIEGQGIRGKLERRDGALLLVFPNDDLERLTLAEGRMLVEHFNPARDYAKPATIMAIGSPLDPNANKRQNGN